MDIELSATTYLSHYRNISRLGAGGMGEVYLAGDPRLERKVAIKVLLVTIAPYAVSARRRFLLNTLIDESGSAPLTVVVNWTAELKR